MTFRLTYDLFTLQKVASLDLDRDGRITRAELVRYALANGMLDES